MIVSVFVRRLKPGATFQDFMREWEADEGFGGPTRMFNVQSLTDPRGTHLTLSVAVNTSSSSEATLCRRSVHTGCTVPPSAAIPS
jgi:hypothetical protein